MASVDLSSITGTYLSSDLNVDSEGRFADVMITQQTIYGRSKETRALLKPYQRLLETRRAQTVIVHGESGSGKTALVDVLRDRLCEDSSGYFVTGKYFQNSGGVQEPHSAITAAFSDLCDLVAQSDDFNRKRQKKIQKTLGPDAHLLVKSISNISPFVGNYVKMQDAESETCAAGKFKIACKSFLRAMASDAHPVIVFLDDIQWADEGSRKLIEMFLHDSELRNVMIILAYRDEEAEQVENILIHARDPVDIQLSNLDCEAVHQLVSSFTGSTAAKDVRGLSNVVTKRTGGNPFHVLLFIEAIQREGLLTVDVETGICSFDVRTIQTEIMASETLADLLTRKIGLLPADITETLKVASLMGYHFDKNVLFEVSCAVLEEKRSDNDENCRDGSISGSSRQSVLLSLSDAVKEGFIETTIDGYQFTHDKLQASFQMLINEQEEDWLHLLIGNAFLADNSGAASQMYNAAVHLNNAPGFLHNRNQRAVLAAINLKAAKYCEEKSAFVQEVKMLQIGLNVLGRNDRWSEENFDMTYEMMESLARAQLIVGDFDGCKETSTEALNHGQTAKMKINLLLIDVEVRMVGNEVDDALSAAFEALRTLGVSMPKKVKLRHVVGKLFKVRRALKSKAKEELLALPVTEDRLVTNAIKLLMHICSYCLVKDEVNAGIYSSLLATELTLTTGLISPYSSSALVMYGVAEISLGYVDQAYKYGQIALAMQEKMTCKEAECTTVGFGLSLLSFWKESFCDLIDPLCRAADSGLQRGDVLYGTYCLSQAYHLHVHAGTHLDIVEASMREKYEMVSDLSQDSMILWFQPIMQSVLNMQSDVSSWENMSVLSGEIMNEEDYFEQLYRSGHPVLVMVAKVTKAEMACDFDQFSLAASIYEEIAGHDKTIALSYAAPVNFWNAARTFQSLYVLSGNRYHLRKWRKYRKLLKRMVDAGSRNAVPLMAFLDAQELAGGRRLDENALHAIYERGFECLAAHKLVHYEGFLNEKAGFEFTRRGWHDEARTYFERALYIYKYEWGATAKYNWLEEQISTLVVVPTKTAAVPHGITVD